jgi:hypothetical protein
MVKLKNKAISFRVFEVDYLRYKALARHDCLRLSEWIQFQIERGIKSDVILSRKPERYVDRENKEIISAYKSKELALSIDDFYSKDKL